MGLVAIAWLGGTPTGGQTLNVTKMAAKYACIAIQFPIRLNAHGDQ